VSQHSRRGTGAGWDGAGCGRVRARGRGRAAGQLVVDTCCVVRRCAHRCRRSAALDVLDDAVEDGDATTHGEQQHRQQRPNGLDTPCPSPRGRTGLGPYLFSGPPALAVAEWYRDVSGRRRWLRAATCPGFNGDNGQARQQQHDGDGVQRLVKGERVVDGRCGAQVSRC
jgi:hypothetical protein